jgi:hypothetical protein
MQLLKDLTRPMRRRVAMSIYGFSPTGSVFNHTDAQRYELEHNAATIRENHERLIVEWNTEKSRGGLWQSEANQWFEGDTSLWQRYVDHIRQRRSLEVGSGPVGYLSPCYWIVDRVIIEPLADEYRARQIAINGKTFFTPDIKAYTKPAEE